MMLRTVPRNMVASRGRIQLIGQRNLTRCSSSPRQQTSPSSLRVPRVRYTASQSTPTKPPTLVAPTSFLVGSFAGILGSLAGMGGGFVMIPLMTSSLLRLTQHQAHGTSLFAVAATGMAGAWGYAEVVQWEEAAAIAVCGMATARFGAAATTKLSASSLNRALGVFMLLVAPLVPAKTYLKELAEQTKPSSSESSDGKASTQQDRWQRLMIPMGIGVGSGFLAGLFGVGGGAIVVPALALGTDMTHYEALGTSLCAMTPPAIVGTITHYTKGNVSLRVAPALAFGSFMGAYVGGKYIGLHTDETTLRYGFAGLMSVLGLKTLIRG